MDLKGYIYFVKLCNTLFSLEHVLLVRCCEHGNEQFTSIKNNEYVDHWGWGRLLPQEGLWPIQCVFCCLPGDIENNEIIVL